jgi:branched-chain amino acid transport system permease protein
VNIIQSLIDAISTGAVYALAAVGISLVFGVLGLANFANGEFITGAGYALVLLWPIAPPLALLAAAAIAVALALGADWAVFRWIRGQAPATLLIASFCLSVVLQRIYAAVFGINPVSAAVAPGLATSIHLGGLRVSLISVVSIVLCAALLIAVRVFLTRTPVGLQVQAAAEDFRSARVLGIRAGGVIALTFAIGGLLAAAVAFVLTVQSGGVAPTFGVQVTIFALVGASIGGLGRLGGSVVGGFIVGFAVSMFTAWLPDVVHNFRIAFVYLLVATVLVLAPNGLFAGRTPKERT